MRLKLRAVRVKQIMALSAGATTSCSAAMAAAFTLAALTCLALVASGARWEPSGPDWSHTFSCGKLYYRTFHMDVQRNTLFVGAM